ncbi:MAG: ATP-dependent helicase HrpB [Pseudolabrys sp.]|nr:ATP-dependent helicase HrpB [Pseudolabrys sp.]
MMRTFPTPLPIDDAVPRLVDALARTNAAVLVAPPGAGKTTRVPLVLLDEAWAKDKKILLLEPRRLAARAAASRMAATLGEQVGDTVGLRVRFGSKISKRTRIEVITEGVFTRLVLDDPSLEGVAAVLFDEFHERSLDADLGLALAREVQEGLREDLKVLVMSATLDGARVAALLGDAPVVTSEGRAFPVETRYLGRDPRERIERPVADAVQRALRADPGSLLVFLPGAAEIRRTETLLKEHVRDPNVDIVALFGALEARDQDRAISPAPPGRRKVVLATSIAETSLTIEGVRVVIDSGLSRVPRYEPDVGLTRLETVRVSRAAADQRRGRAGRTEPGVCYRLWEEPQTGSLEAYTRPEILSADLSSFVLDLAQWGASDASKLAFLDPPPSAAMSEAKALLVELGAIDTQGRITDEGRRLRQLPLPPRLARMVVDAGAEGAGAEAAAIAAILTERGLGGDDVDLRHRLDQFRRDRSRRAEDTRAMVKRWEAVIPGRAEGANPESRDTENASGFRVRSSGPSRNDEDLSTGAILALAYPDRVAKSRGGGTGGFVLANGRGGQVDAASNLAREPFLVVAELTGAAASSRIVLAAAITLAEIEERFAGKIENRDAVTFDAGSASLRARRSRRLGSVVLAEQVKQVTPDADTARILAQGLVGQGLDRLDWSKAALQFRTRVEFLRKAEGDEWPDLGNDGLARSAADWLEPLLTEKTARGQLSAGELFDAVSNQVAWNLRRRLEAEAPTHFTAPTGSAVPIDYEAEQGPTVSIRVQELFGLTQHPSIAGGRIPLVIELLSPGHKPVQITRDLPGFWRGSYADVRTDLRGRYPRHPWPEDPTSALPTRRAKPKGT